MRAKSLVIVIGAAVMMTATAAVGAECNHNNWQPTFVRHSSVAPTVYYVEPGARTFTPMQSPQQAQQTCRQRGVREPINGQTCWQRSWGDFGCGCNIRPSPNSTCARFQRFLGLASHAQYGAQITSPSGDGNAAYVQASLKARAT